jgi:hypothetical protein
LLPGSWLGPGVLVCLLLYRINYTRSTVKLKHHSLFDALAIAFGFMFSLIAVARRWGGRQ